MPKLEVEGVGTFDVEEGKRLVLSIEEDVGKDITPDPLWVEKPGTYH